jgi:multidrug resistance efflux pump/pimeloyl-ACP methyl ester carboxylesterase
VDDGLKPGPTTLSGGDFDESATLVAQQILHRLLPDQSGQDYFVYRAGRDRRDGPLIVAVHGISRNAREAAEVFAGTCERYGATLIAPHFAADRYPNFQRLGRSRHPADRGKGADEALASILEDVARLTGVPVQRIYLFGFGAGGRFALRYAMAHPERVAGVVIASVEAYTFPDPDRRFPRGIATGAKRRDLVFRPEEFLRVPMTVLEGSRADGPPGSRPAVRAVRSAGTTPGARARAWVAAMRAAAKAQHFEPLVDFREVDSPLDSYAAFARDATLRERVFEVLLFRTLPALPAVVAAQAVVDRAAERDGWLEIRPEVDEELLVPGMPPSPAQRFALPGILIALLLAVLTPLAIWATYRANHVVSREAVVRSYIADVGARIDGVIKSIDVDTGDRVRAGQVIARLEDRHYEARVTQARSQLEKARRELEVERLAIENERQRLAGSLREVSAELSAARASVLASQSRADEAARQVELQRSLAARGLVPAERVRTAETELRTAQALVAEARADVAAAGAGEDLARVASEGIAVREKRISVLESDIANHEARLALAEANLEATLIRATDDGAVVRRIVQPGASIAVGQPVVALWVGEKIWVEAWLDEDDLADVAVGSQATVTFKSHPDREFTGVVETLGVSTDVELPDSAVPQRREHRMRNAPVISVRVRLDEPAEDLFPGLSAVVGIRKKAD